MKVLRTIRIEALLRTAELEIKIWDYGSAFDLHGLIADTSQKHNNWLSSGRGIPLVNKLSDYLDLLPH